MELETPLITNNTPGFWIPGKETLIT